nr:PREDICTED: protein lunapark isoform X2 [Bemisia tabaci]
MGIILSKFRKKKSSEEVLESIEETISSIEESQKESQLQQKKIRQFSYISVTFLVIAAFSYVYFFSKTLRRPQTVLIIIPVLVLGEVLRRFITWYYQRKIKQTQKKLIDLRAQKKRILDEVMNNETFNKAKEILEKYAPDQLPKGSGMVVPLLGHRATPVSGAKTPAVNNPAKKSLFSPDKSVVPSPTVISRRSLVNSQPSHNLPRPILPTEKTILEKLVELIVGDGPSQRFALICSACNSHNGMALKEEFEYLGSRGVPSTALRANNLLEDQGGEDIISDKSSTNLNRVMDGESNGEAVGEVGHVVDNTFGEHVTNPVDNEISRKVINDDSNKLNGEVDSEIICQKNSALMDDMKMEVDESLTEKDLGEYVSDEESSSETESPLKTAETAKVH